MFGYATVMVCIYPIGCPLLLLVMLFRFKHLLHPAGRDGQEEEDKVIAERKESAELAANPITAFALPYRPPYWVSLGWEGNVLHLSLDL